MATKIRVKVANLKFDLQSESTMLSLLSCIFVMFFTQRFRLYMFCLFPLSEPYNPPS